MSVINNVLKDLESRASQITPFAIYRLTAIAALGVYGSLDYVQRRLQATVSVDPP
ncbi:MAG: hypothetical protein GY785_22495 [Gammaproteobacteria bacterium]|nr:hypothetical protein [Gammaproteobacteria bacterium]